jgi:hypothetical protein
MARVFPTALLAVETSLLDVEQQLERQGELEQSSQLILPTEILCLP